MWEKFRLEWNYNSNRIEGNTLTYSETEALLVLGEEPKRMAKDIREIKAHDLAISHFLELVDHERLIDEADIRNLNKITLKEPYFRVTITADGTQTRKEIIPGAYKTDPNHVRLRGGETHRFAEPGDVPTRMAETIDLVREYLDNQNRPLPDFLAELHHQFIETHPFDDGNGRVVRMLVNYVCLKLGWPPVIIKDDKKSEYLTALEFADKGDITLLIQVFEGELAWSLGKSIKAAKGEPIDDVDDIDKEIDMFVKNKMTNISPTGDKKIRSPQTVSMALESVTIPVMEGLEARLEKFKPLFAGLNIQVSAKQLKNGFNSPAITSKDVIHSIHTLSGFIDGTNHFNLKCTLLTRFEFEHFIIRYTIVGGGANAVISMDNIKYGISPSERQLKDFHRDVNRALILKIKNSSESN